MRGVPLIVEAGLGLRKTVTWILRNINPEIDYLRSGARVAHEILEVLAIYCLKTHQKFPFPTIDSRGPPSSSATGLNHGKSDFENSK